MLTVLKGARVLVLFAALMTAAGLVWAPSQTEQNLEEIVKRELDPSIKKGRGWPRWHMLVYTHPQDKDCKSAENLAFHIGGKNNEAFCCLRSLMSYMNTSSYTFSELPMITG